MSSAYHAEYEESDSDTDHDCNAIDMSVIKNDMAGAANQRSVSKQLSSKEGKSLCLTLTEPQFLAVIVYVIALWDKSV